MIIEVRQDDESFVSAFRNQNRNFAMFYFPDGKGISLNLKNLSGQIFKITWFAPITGAEFLGNDGKVIFKEIQTFISPPSSGGGNE